MGRGGLPAPLGCGEACGEACGCGCECSAHVLEDFLVTWLRHRLLCGGDIRSQEREWPCHREDAQGPWPQKPGARGSTEAGRLVYLVLTLGEELAGLQVVLGCSGDREKEERTRVPVGAMLEHLLCACRDR